MATLINPESAPSEVPEGHEVVDFNTINEPAAPAPAEPVVPDAEPESDIPEKYRGKSPAELIAMHQEAERFNGKQSSEVGELRRSVDQLIQAQLSTPAAPAPAAPAEEESETDFFDDPNAAVNAAIQNHPDVIAAKEAAAKSARATAQRELAVKHPDMQSIVDDEKFIAWVGDSNIRRQLFQRAYKNYDYDAADELFTGWKDKKGIVAQTLAVEEKERKQAVKAAGTGAATTSNEQAPRKMFRRADVIRLMNEQPDRYLAMAEEIMAAYREGRVIP